MNKAFFIVWNPNGLTVPKFQHPTRKSAQFEAIRLASIPANIGQRFHVCRVESFACAPITPAALIKLSAKSA